MPGRRRTSPRRKAIRPHVYRGVPSPGLPNPNPVPPRRSANWNQWLEHWGLYEYTPEQAREAHMVTVQQIADRVKRTRGTVTTALRDSLSAPRPVGLLVREGESYQALLYASKEVTRWVRATRPQWLLETHPHERETDMAEYRTLTGQELTVFDKESTAMVLDAMEAGVLGYVSKRSHAILRNAAGNTMSISRKMALPNRSAQNTRAQYKRFMNDHREFLKEHPEEQPATVDEPLPASEVDDGSWFCTLCQLPFPLSEKDNHMTQTHPGYTFCTYQVDGVPCGALVKKNGMGPHIRLAHKVTHEERIAAGKKAAATKRANREAREKEAAEEQRQAMEVLAEPFADQITDEQAAEAIERDEKEKESVSERVNRAIESVKEEPALITDEQIAEELAKPAPPAEYFDPLKNVRDAVGIVNKIRDLIGQDPRIAELEAQIVTLTEERDAAIKSYEELEAKIALAREAFGL